MSPSISERKVKDMGTYDTRGGTPRSPDVDEIPTPDWCLRCPEADECTEPCERLKMWGRERNERDQMTARIAKKIVDRRETEIDTDELKALKFRACRKI